MRPSPRTAAGAGGGPVVLALRALGLGDLLAGVPALRALRRAHPDGTLVLAVPAPLHGLVRASGLADAVVDAAPLVPLHRPPVVDVAVNLHGRGPRSHAVLLALPGPPRILAFACPEAGVPGPPWREDEHERDRWCRMLAWHGIPADPGDLRIRPPGYPPGVAMANWPPARPIGRPVIVHAGASSPARRWPPERFAAVARDLAARARILLTGSPDERALAMGVAADAGLPAEAVLAGRTDPAQLAHLVSRSSLVVSGDTGIAHLAVALGTPSVTVFGPTPPDRWGPPQDPRHRVLWHGIPGPPHGDAPGPGLRAVTVAAVTAAAHAVLDGTPAGAPSPRA